MTTVLSSSIIGNEANGSTVRSWLVRHGGSAPFGGHETLLTGLAAYFPLSGDASDVTESVASGAEQGSVAHPDGINGPCTDFGTAQNYYKWIPDLTFEGGSDGELSFSVWVYMPSGRAYSDTRYVFSSSDHTYAFYIKSREPGINTGGGYDQYTEAMSEDTWHHIAVCYPGWESGIEGYIVVDNDWEGRLTFSNQYKPIIEVIGTIESESGTRHWQGYLAELGFWNRRLSETEVASLYNDGNGLFFEAV